MEMPDLWIKELKVIMKTREARCSCERVKIITPANQSEFRFVIALIVSVELGVCLGLKLALMRRAW